MSHRRYEAPCIAGSPATLTPLQRDLLGRVAELAPRWAARAAAHDRDASFPAENFAELRDAGLLGLCVPVADGGLGADVATTVLVVAEIGRWCGATALGFNMHAGVGLWSGLVADALPMAPAMRREHERLRAAHHRRTVEGGELFAQPFSEVGPAAADAAPWRTTATRVDGGYVVHGRKIFASLAGVADAYAVPCTLQRPGEEGRGTRRDALLLAVPARAAGVSVEGDWDPLGMRATVSRNLRFENVFVPDEARLLPEGLAFEATTRFPHVFATLAAPYLGIAQAAYDFTVRYLRAELPGQAPVKRRMYPTKQHAVAEMRLKLEAARALFLRSAQEAALDPDTETRLRLFAAHHTVGEHAQAVCALAVRTCGGQSLHKSLPLERLYRDSRCASLMLPWTAELCLDRLGREGLYADGEDDEVIEP